MKKVKKQDTYAVGSKAESIRASVDVGVGQLGTISMRVDEKLVGISPSPVGQRDLGTAQSLAGRLLLVEALVTDVSIMTNKMSVIVHLSGGKSVKKVTAKDEVTEDGESMLFQTFIRFTK